MLEIVPTFNYLLNILEEMQEGKPLSFKRINLIGSRFSGKTFSAMIFIQYCFLIGKRVRIRFFRDKMEGIKQSWEELKQIIISEEFHYLPWKINETNKTLKLFGSELSLHSHHRTNNSVRKFMGMTSDFMFDYSIKVNEEAHEITKASNQDSIEAIRGCPNFLEIYVSNPWAKRYDFIKEVVTFYPQDEFKLKKYGEQIIIDKENKCITHYNNWRTNKELHQSEKDKMLYLERVDPIRARVASFGLVGIEEGGIFAPIMQRINYEIRKDNFYFVGGLDYGSEWDSTATVLVGFDKIFNNVSCLGAFEWNNKRMYRKGHKEMATDIINFYINKASQFPKLHEMGITVYCDTSSYAFISILNDMAFVKKVSSWLVFQGCGGKDLVEYGIAIIIGLISQGRLWMSDDCRPLIQNMEDAVWDEKSKRAQPVDKDNDVLDAFRYAIKNRVPEIRAGSDPTIWGGRKW